MSNPFTSLPPLPTGATGARGFGAHADAKRSAEAQAGGSYAILSAPKGVQLGAFSVQFGTEYAWVAPARAYTVRAAAALAAGIKLVELVA